MAALNSIDDVVSEYSSLASDIEKLMLDHEAYVKRLDELHKRQVDEKKRISSHFGRVAKLKDAVKKLEANETISEAEKGRLRDMHTDITDSKTHLADMLDELPRDSNGAYLSVILGSTLDISLMSKNDKFRYKDEYEKFKERVTYVVLVTSFIAYIFSTRLTDAMTHFLLVWYYCTLTIRESVLIVNGSKIKGWWLYHHFVSAILCGIALTWPDTECYRDFRTAFLAFCGYLAIVQLMQVQYQRGCLRRLRALGQRHAMDITVEGFHSWMFKGLTFLLPFLVLGYILQLYNALLLVYIWRTHDCSEWQVLALAALFFTVCIGNCTTTWKVCYRKFFEKRNVAAKRRLTSKYSTAVPGARVGIDAMDALMKESDDVTSREHKKSN